MLAGMRFPRFALGWRFSLAVLAAPIIGACTGNELDACDCGNGALAMIDYTVVSPTEGQAIAGPISFSFSTAQAIDIEITAEGTSVGFWHTDGAPVVFTPTGAARTIRFAFQGNAPNSVPEAASRTIQWSP